MSLNPEIDDLMKDCAAHLFWRLAAQSSRSAVDLDVIESKGWCLTAQSGAREVVDKLLKEHGIRFAGMDLYDALDELIREHAFDSARKEQTLPGRLYIDEVRSCRTPSAAGIDVSNLCCIPKAIRVTNRGFRVERSELYLRHPLPSVVFINHDPRRGRPEEFVVEVSTRKALGFELPMWLIVESVTRAADDLYFLGGTLQIPVPTRDSGKLWDRAILNSIRVVDRVTTFSLAGARYEAEIAWPWRVHVARLRERVRG